MELIFNRAWRSRQHNCHFIIVEQHLILPALFHIRGGGESMLNILKLVTPIKYYAFSVIQFHHLCFLQNIFVS